MPDSDTVPRPPRIRLPDRTWVPALIGLLLGAAFVAALLVRAQGDVSLLVHAAPVWTDAADDPPGSLTVQPDEDDAFDGQFFYRLGVSPFSTDETVAGVTFDLPALRNARWGYGALAFVASGGDEDLLPWALVGLNVAALTAVGALGGALAGSSGRHRAWGALLVAWPGFAYSLSLDTSEVVASAFVLGGLVAARRRQWVAAALLLSAAVLTRDTTAVVPVGVAVAGGWTWWSTRTSPHPQDADLDPDLDEDADVQPTGPGARRGPAVAGPIGVGAVALAVFGAWQLLAWVRFGALPLTSSGDNNLSLPLAGLADQAGSLLPPGGGSEAFRLVSLVGLVALLGAAGWLWARSSTPVAERFAWLGAVAVVVVLNSYLWSGATAFMRAATEAGLLSILIIIGSGRRVVLLATGLGLGGLWALTAAAQLSKLG